MAEDRIVDPPVDPWRQGRDRDEGGADGAQAEGAAPTSRSAASRIGRRVGLGSRFGLRPRSSGGSGSGIRRRRCVRVGAHGARNPEAAATARTTAAALLTVSSCSLLGTESATIPAPACTCATPSTMTAVRIAIAMSRSPWTSK